MPIFARYSIPDVSVHNSLQYLSQEFGEYVKKSNYKYTTSSPYYP